MNFRPSFIFIILILPAAIFLLLDNVAGQDLSEPTELTFSLIGTPLAEKNHEARRINHLRLFNDRLYIGCGDAVANTGPTPVMYYDLKSNSFTEEYTVDEEAIYKFHIVEGKLAIAGIDAVGNDLEGFVYIRESEGWQKSGPIPKALHVHNFVSMNNKWYAATSNAFEFNNGQLFSYGGIVESSNLGKSWNLMHSTPSDSRTVHRVNDIQVYGNKLYAFFYAFTPLAREQIPKEYHPFLGQSRNNRHLILDGNPLGSVDTLVYDGRQWKYENIFADREVCLIRASAYRGNLVLFVISGRFIDYSNLNQPLPDDAFSEIYLLDKSGVSKVDLGYDLLIAGVTKTDCLCLLIMKDEHYYICRTGDLQNWTLYPIPECPAEPRTIEFDGNRFFLGTGSGELYQSQTIAK